MPDRQPWYKKYPTDWRGDTNLRACSLSARGLWDECLGLMHEAEPRGFLVFAGEPVTVDKLALLVSSPLKEVRAALAELEHAGVPSRDEHGTIYSRRMVRDTAKSKQASAYGARGGNPRLKGHSDATVNPTLNPWLNPAGARTRDLSSEISLEATDGLREGEPEREPTPSTPKLVTARFETFWDAYPAGRRGGKKAAQRAFERLKPDHELLAVLLDAVARQRTTRQWREGFAPHASTWLNGERWTDDVTEDVAAPAVKRAVGPPARSWRDGCPHEPTCETPTACALATAKAEEPARAHA